MLWTSFVLGLCIFAASTARAADTGPLPSTVRTDPAGFREDVLGYLKPVVGNDIVAFGDDFVLRLTSPVNGQRVEINLGNGYRYCLKLPRDCHNEIVVLYRQFSGPLATGRTARDKRDARDDSVQMVKFESTELEDLVPRSDASKAGISLPTQANPHVSGTDIPLDDDGFSSFVANKLQLYTPMTVTTTGSSYLLTIGRPLGVTIVYSSGGTQTLTLTDLRGECLQKPTACAQLVDDFVQASARVIQRSVPDKNNLRMGLATKVLRTSSLYSRRGAQMYAFTDVSTPTFGNFYVVCYGSEESMLMMPALHALGISVGEALSLCVNNTRAAIGPMNEAYGTTLPPDGIGMVMGSQFESARLYFGDDWKPLVQAFGGLLVSAPARRVIIYAKDDGDKSVQALRERARSIKSQAGDHALSSSVFRWTKDGWKVAADDD